MTTDLEPIATPPPEPAPDVAPAQKRRPTRLVITSLVLAVLAIAAAAVTVLVTRDTEPSPARLLADARKFVAAQKTAAFRGQLRIESKDPESEGGSFVDRARIRGKARLPDQAQYRLVSDGYASEIITLGERIFTRDAPGADALEKKKWSALEPNVDDARSGVVRPDAPTQAVDAVGDPLGLFRTLEAARRPVLVSREGKIAVVKADVDAERAFGAVIEGAVDRATVELTLKGKALDRIVLAATGDAGSLRADYVFTGWGQPVTVAAPADKDLDPTPGIEEEEIADFKAAKLLQPRGIPAGWVLEFAGVLPADQTAEGCRQVELDYTDPEDPDEGYLTLYEMPKTCTDMDLPRGAEAFEAGRWRGWVDDSPDGLLAQILVGDTILQAETDLSADSVARILAELVPLNLAVAPAALPGFGPTTPA